MVRCWPEVSNVNTSELCKVIVSPLSTHQLWLSEGFAQAHRPSTGAKVCERTNLGTSGYLAAGVPGPIDGCIA